MGISLLKLNGENIIANFEYHPMNTISIKCELDRYGNIEFDEAYIVGLFKVFKKNEFSSNIILESCSVEDKYKNLSHHSLLYLTIFTCLKIKKVSLNKTCIII